MRIAAVIMSTARGEGADFTADVQRIYDIVGKIGPDATDAEGWAQYNEATYLAEMPNMNLTDVAVQRIRAEFTGKHL